MQPYRPLSAVAVAYIDATLNVGVSNSICVKSPIEGAIGTRGDSGDLEAVNHVVQTSVFLTKVEM